MDDFLYLCDDAYTHDDLLKMERDILRVLDYDINIPVAYRFLRRLARVCDPSHPPLLMVMILLCYRQQRLPWKHTLLLATSVRAHYRIIHL